MRASRPRLFVLLAALPLVFALSSCPGPRHVDLEGTPAPSTPSTPAATPVPIPTPPPTPYVPNKRLEVGKIFNGMQIRTTLQTEFGTHATKDREDPSSYGVDVQVRVKVPKPHRDLEEISRLNPQLPTVLPQLPILLNSAKISPFFDDLYRLKVTSLQQNLQRLDQLLSRHNFYDCETVLELEHPISKRRAILLQADMDTDNDGSDSDRVPEVDGSSATFQPFTSYKWGKKTQQPNSFIGPRTVRLRQIEQEMGMSGVSASRGQQLRAQHAALKSEISDLQKYSYLVGSTDPYIVLPGSMFSRKYGGFTPGVGDFCLVIYGNTLFPAVVGDVGPSDLVGEASLRICRQINARADANNRPVNDLKATYLIFPGSAQKPFDVPNLDQWRVRCESLLKDIGGYEGQLIEWEDLTKPKPSPATPAPATPAPSPLASPGANGSPIPGAPVRATPAPPVAPAPSTPSPTPSPLPATPAPASHTPSPPATSSVPPASPAGPQHPGPS